MAPTDSPTKLDYVVSAIWFIAILFLVVLIVMLIVWIVNAKTPTAYDQDIFLDTMNWSDVSDGTSNGLNDTVYGFIRLRYSNGDVFDDSDFTAITETSLRVNYLKPILGETAKIDEADVHTIATKLCDKLYDSAKVIGCSVRIVIEPATAGASFYSATASKGYVSVLRETSRPTTMK